MYFVDLQKHNLSAAHYHFYPKKYFQPVESTVFASPVKFEI